VVCSLTQCCVVARHQCTALSHKAHRGQPAQQLHSAVLLLLLLLQARIISSHTQVAEVGILDSTLQTTCRSYMRV